MLQKNSSHAHYDSTTKIIIIITINILTTSPPWNGWGLYQITNLLIHSKHIVSLNKLIIDTVNP